MYFASEIQETCNILDHSDLSELLIILGVHLLLDMLTVFFLKCKFIKVFKCIASFSLKLAKYFCMDKEHMCQCAVRLCVLQVHVYLRYFHVWGTCANCV